MKDGDLESLILEMHSDIKGIKVAIQGNGTKGLNERVNDVEGDLSGIKENVIHLEKGHHLFKWAGGVLTALIIAVMVAFFTNLPARLFPIEIESPMAIEQPLG